MHRRVRKPLFPAAPAVVQAAAELGVFALTILVALAAILAFYARDLPDTDGLWGSDRTPRVTLLAADGAPVRTNGASLGAPVRLADLPDYVPKAVLAVEDRNFYHHVGVNPLSVARAFFVNAAEGEIRQGGSTITQQLAKNLFLSSERTIKRKVQELLLALWLERRFSKDEILTLYLNRVYFGAGSYGVDAASHRYFAKSAQRLTLGEAAVLAGLLKAPSRYAPTHNPEDAGARARRVIDSMVTAGFLGSAEAEAALSRPVMLAAPRFAAASYFIDYALHEARNLAGDADADLIVRTTFDPALQAAAENGLGAAIAADARVQSDMQAAVVIIDGEGAVRAMIGGRDYHKSQFNRAVQAKRQPGSAFKPFIYLAALERGARPEDRLTDAPVKIGKWAPDNYNSRYYGSVTLREALARSLNSATIRLQEAIGRNAVRRTARAMGLDGPLNPGPALALGVDVVSPLELAAAYAPFANGGYRIAPHVIESIETAEGDVLFRRQATVLDVAASYQSILETNDMLRNVTRWGTGRAAALSRFPAAGKTGTSQESRDAWFAGHAGGLVAVVWIGRDDNTPMKGITGGGPPAVVWREVMERALAARQPARFGPPLVAPLQIGPAETEDDPLAALLNAQR
ncbi:MAG: transglycosylase domain-containing protein [Parvularculaceae bacterium]